MQLTVIGGNAQLKCPDCGETFPSTLDDLDLEVGGDHSRHCFSCEADFMVWRISDEEFQLETTEDMEEIWNVCLEDDEVSED